MWQYTSDGDINDDGSPDGRKLGFETTALDLNAWLGSVQEWSAYCGGTPPPVTPPPPPPAEDDVLNIILKGIVRFSQNNPLWSKDKLGKSTSTMGGWGCLVTAAATVARYFGIDIDPGRLNKLMTGRNLYYNGNLFVFDALETLFGIKVDWENFIDCADVPAPLDKIDAILARKLPVVVKVDYDTNDDDVDQHWVVIYGKVNGSYIISDTWDGLEKKFEDRYGDPKRYIFKIVTWIGVPQEPTPDPDPVPVPEQETAVVWVKKVISSSGLNVRKEAKITATIREWMQKDTKVFVLDTTTRTGEIWHRVGINQWCAELYNGIKLME
jgi:hypothetical protein